MGQVAPRSTLTASWLGLCPAGLWTLLEVAAFPTIKKHLSAAAPLCVLGYWWGPVWGQGHIGAGMEGGTPSPD